MGNKENNKVVGNWGEEQAVLFLMENGYKILSRNWTHEKVELDIIAEKEETVVFIEVKTRSYVSFGQPEVAVNKTKRAHIIRAAKAYIYKNNVNKEIRFDIISIVRKPDKPEIYHIVDAIIP